MRSVPSSTVVPSLTASYRTGATYLILLGLTSKNLAIISFHDSAGTQILNTTIVGNAVVLLPVINGPIATCHLQDVCFVRVTCIVNFTGLISIPN
jgi:hypothetical protein